MSNGSCGDDDSKVVALNVKVVVKPEHRGEFLKLIKTDAQQSRTVEPGCLQFMAGKDVDDDNIFYLHEQYENQAALDFHNGTPHLQDVLKFVTDKDPLVEPIVINTYKCQHVPQKIDNSQFESYCLNVESCVKPELRDEFLELMTSHQLKSQAEQACLQFDWGVSNDDPNTFYIHEEYENKDGFDAHEQSTHFAKFIKFNDEKKPYTQPQVVQFYTNLKY